MEKRTSKSCDCRGDGLLDRCSTAPSHYYVTTPASMRKSRGEHVYEICYCDRKKSSESYCKENRNNERYMSQRSLGNLTITGTQPKITPRREENDLEGENEENYLAFLRMRKSLRGRRSRVKRWCKWAFMASLCCGIFVSLTGIVVGFVVLAPFYAKGMNVTEKCGRGQFLCAKNTCVHPRMICNGIKDCEDGSDEMHCGKNVSINLSKIIPSPDQIMNGTHIEPSNWAYFRNGSRGGSKYLVIDSIMSFYDAQQRCKVLGGGVAGHLAHVNTIQEQLFIESYISKLMARHKISKSGSGFWIGAVRDRKDPGGMCMHNQWQWKDAEKRTLGYISGFTAFAPEKPDDVYSPEECLYISHILGDDPARFLKWDDAACDLQGTSGIKVLCEIDMNRIDYGSSGR